eukprot:4655856-Pleurochrysis_carterae.AAC.3
MAQRRLPVYDPTPTPRWSPTGCCTEKPPTERLANKWSALLHSAGMQQSACARPPIIPPVAIDSRPSLDPTTHGLSADPCSRFPLTSPSHRCQQAEHLNFIRPRACFDGLATQWFSPCAASVSFSAASMGSRVQLLISPRLHASQANPSPQSPVTCHFLR